MNSVLKAILVLLIVSVSFNSYSQTREAVFASIQKIVNRATGEKIKSFSGEEKITKQVFTPNEVSCFTKSLSKYGSEWVKRYTGIPWNDLFEHVIFDQSGDGKIKIVKLRFKKNFKSEHFTSDEAGDDDPSEYNWMELYAMAKDKDDLDKYLELLYTFKEKKAESAFNAQIRRFTKDQTIAWLKDKMNNYVEGGQFDRDFKISLDECKMVITYSGLARKYEEVIPTNIKSISKYGGFEYASNVASIRSLTADMLDNGEKKYRAFSSVGISTRDEEVVENIECAMKHLASFCGNTTAASISTNSNRYTAVFQDDFSTNGYKWLEGENGEYKFKVSEGKYMLQSKAGGYWFSTRPISFNTGKDFEISARIKKTAGTNGYYFGLVLGYELSSKHHHFAGITGQGNVVFANKGAAPADLIPGTIYTAVNKGNASNVITIKKSKNVIRMYVNSQLIGETNYQPLYGTYFGFQLWSGNEHLTIEVEDFVIKTME